MPLQSSIPPTVHHKSRKPERKPSIPTISQALEPRICVTKNINFQKKEARFLFLPIISHPHRLCGRAAATQIRFAHGYLCRAATPHGFLKEVVASYKGRKDQLPVCNDRCKEVGREVTLSSCSICSGDERLKPKGLDACIPRRPQPRRTEEGYEILLPAQPPLVNAFIKS